MIQLDRTVWKQAKSGEMSLDALAEYLLKTYPVYEIARSLAETIQYEEPKPILLTKAEFDAHFRIRGIRPDGTEETRGRRKDSVQGF